jgi:hypothetical protein
MISHELLGTTASISDDNSKDKYILVDEVLSATNYYEALGLSNDSSYDEIRRAYIKVQYNHGYIGASNQIDSFFFAEKQNLPS